MTEPTTKQVQRWNQSYQNAQLMRDKLMDLYVPIRIATALSKNSNDDFKLLIVNDFDNWRIDVLAGKHDEELKAIRGLGPNGIAQLKHGLRKNRPGTQFPEPENHYSTSPSPASKAEATVKPNGVSYSIHVDNVHNAVALSWLASVFDDQGVYDMALDSLSMLLHHIAEGYYPEQSTPEADKLAIQSMERLIEKIRKANQ
ncbi:MAG: hypothetical protein KAX65_00165 [Caldilineaceae bacterium]|nr:hypothetical protein [Caldilineaceae bacterium]